MLAEMGTTGLELAEIWIRTVVPLQTSNFTQNVDGGNEVAVAIMKKAARTVSSGKKCAICMMALLVMTILLIIDDLGA
jgi:hypothetical protein